MRSPANNVLIILEERSYIAKRNVKIWTEVACLEDPEMTVSKTKQKQANKMK